MWMLLPALSLAFVHIAGDNAGVVPDAAIKSAGGIYATVAMAYLVMGSVQTGLAAWLGVRSGTELGVLVKRLFGCGGKRVLAAVTLGISLPASALTGGYFAGWLVHYLIGLPVWMAVPCCLLAFTLLASGYWHDLLLTSNYCSLLLVPAILIMVLHSNASPVSLVWSVDAVDWPLMMALYGYNAGGMRPALAAEAAACMMKKGGRAIALTVAAKLVEGLFTLAMAYIVIAAGTTGPLALAAAAAGIFGSGGASLFAFVLLCTFANTMAPAMAVNARYLACWTGLPFGQALVTAGLVVYGITFLPYEWILRLMAVTGGITAAFIGYTAFKLHKSAANQQ